MADAHFRGTLSDLFEVFHGLAEAVSGHSGDYQPYAQQILLRMGISLLSSVQIAFIAKSRGQVGSDGIQWQPLKKETIANRRITGAEKKAAGVTGHRNRGLLTPAQDQKWRAIFASVYHRLALELGDGAAKAKAAQAAWAILKGEGAKTKLDIFGNRQVDILRDTGMLLRSLSPVAIGQPLPPGQIVRMEPGAIEVGSNLKPWHHAGVPGRLPARPFWPSDGSIPASWMESVVDAASGGISEALENIIRKNPRIDR